MYLSVIIPAYNEEKRLPKTLREVSKYLSQQGYQYEIIVVSDGSKDGTVQAVKNMQGEIKNLKLIDNKENHGKGYVVRQGLLEAQGEIRLFMDADNSTTVDQVEKLLPYFKEGYEIVIGSRDARGAVVAVRQPLYRVALGEIFNILVQTITGLWGIWDSQCGFKALTSQAVKEIMPKCRIDRWAFDPEVLKIGRRLGFKIKEAPIVWVNDAESKVKFSGMVKMLIDLLQIRWNLMTGKYK